MGKGSEEAREGLMRMQGNGGRRRGLYKPPPRFFIPEASEAAQKLRTASFELNYPP